MSADPVPVVRGGPTRPTYAVELLGAQERLTVPDAIGLALRRSRFRAGTSQREYAQDHGWSKSFQARLESRAQDLRLRDLLTVLGTTDYGLVLVPRETARSVRAEDWSRAEVLARDAAGRRFPAARDVRRTTEAPAWWMWRHGADFRVRWPEWTSAGRTTVASMEELRVRPKLAVDGADRAIEFYREVFGAQLVSRYTMGSVVVFAQLEFPGGDGVQVKDADDVDPSPGDAGGGAIVDIVCHDPDSVARRAVARGAEVVFAVQDQPYGARQGRIRDPFGHQWIVGTAITTSDDEIQGALDAWTAGGTP